MSANANKNADVSSEAPKIVRKCSGPETAFNNISNNGGATIGCVTQVNLARPISCDELLSLFDLLYRKYEILRLRFYLKQKTLYWCEASREQTFNVSLLDSVSDKKHFTRDFLRHELCDLYPHGSNLWSIKFCPFTEEARQEESLEDVESADKEKFAKFLISFRCNHGFLDGVGVMSLFQDFGNIISEFVNTSQLPEFEPVGLSAPYEDLVPEAKFVWALRQFASVGIRFVETFTTFKKSLPNYYPVQNMLRLEKFKPRAWNHDKDVAEATGVSHQYFVMDERQLELFQKFRKAHKLSFSGFLMSLLSMGMMKYAFKGFEWPSKLLAFDCLRDTRMYFKDSYANRSRYVTNYIGATMPVLFLAAAFSEKRFREKTKMRSHGSIVSENSAANPTQNLSVLADGLTDYSKTQSRIITEIIRKRSASMVTLKSVAYYLQAFADPEKARRLFSLIRSKDFTEGRTSFAGFSNLGRVDADPEQVDIQSLVAAIDISRFIYCINYIVVTVKNKVHITMSYPSALYCDDSMQELKGAIQEVITMVLDRFESVSALNSNFKPEDKSNTASCSKSNPLSCSKQNASPDLGGKVSPFSAENCSGLSKAASWSEAGAAGDVKNGGSTVAAEIWDLPVDDSDDIDL